MEEKKDEQLNALFKDCVAGEKAPSKNVTLKATEYMREAKAEERVPVAEISVQGANVSAPDGGGKRKYYFIAIAGGFLLLCAMLLFFFLGKGGNADFSSATKGEGISLTQLDEANDYSSGAGANSGSDSLPSSSAFDGGVFGFIPKESVTEYKEYVLRESVGGYGAEETVIYYVEYTYGEYGVEIYAEADGICLDDLNFYKQYSKTLTYSDITFYYDIDGEEATSYAYFKTDSFGYNLEVSTSDKAVLESFLSYVAKNI